MFIKCIKICQTRNGSDGSFGVVFPLYILVKMLLGKCALGYHVLGLH